MLSPDKSWSWCCSSYKLLLVRERREGGQRVHKFGLNSTQLLQLRSTPSPISQTAPHSSRSGGLEGCSGRAAKLPPTNQASCSLNRRHRYQRPPACSFPTHNMMSCTSNKTCLRWHQTQHHLPTATALYLHCSCVMHNKYV